jgi:hypothetical protein
MPWRIALRAHDGTILGTNEPGKFTGCGGEMMAADRIDPSAGANDPSCLRRMCRLCRLRTDWRRRAGDRASLVRKADSSLRFGMTNKGAMTNKIV